MLGGLDIIMGRVTIPTSVDVVFDDHGDGCVVTSWKVEWPRFRRIIKQIGEHCFVESLLEGDRDKMKTWSLDDLVGYLVTESDWLVVHDDPEWWGHRTDDQNKAAIENSKLSHPEYWDNFYDI
jgi:hypothetical protein